MRRELMGDHLYDYINGTRPEILNWYLFVAKKIQEGSNEGLKSILKDHEQLIESRTEWKDCQKTARRRRIIAFWLSDSGNTLNDLKGMCR